MRIIIGTLFSFFLTCFSCNKENSIPVSYVPDYLKQMAPYTDGQTIQYSNFAGSTINVSIQKSTYISQISSCSGCQVTSKVESILFKLMVGTNNFADISIDKRPIVITTIFSPEQNFNFGGGFDIQMDETTKQPYCNSTFQTCLSSISLNGTLYNNVIEVRRGASQPNQLEKAYFIKSIGLIGFRYVNGLTYSRL